MADSKRCYFRPFPPAAGRELESVEYPEPAKAAEVRAPVDHAAVARICSPHRSTTAPCCCHSCSTTLRLRPSTTPLRRPITSPTSPRCTTSSEQGDSVGGAVVGGWGWGALGRCTHLVGTPATPPLQPLTHPPINSPLNVGGATPPTSLPLWTPTPTTASMCVFCFFCFFSIGKEIYIGIENKHAYPDYSAYVHAHLIHFGLVSALGWLVGHAAGGARLRRMHSGDGRQQASPSLTPTPTPHHTQSVQAGGSTPSLGQATTPPPHPLKQQCHTL